MLFLKDVSLLWVVSRFELLSSESHVGRAVSKISLSFKHDSIECSQYKNKSTLYTHQSPVNLAMLKITRSEDRGSNKITIFAYQINLQDQIQFVTGGGRGILKGKIASR